MLNAPPGFCHSNTVSCNNRNICCIVMLVFNMDFNQTRTRYTQDLSRYSVLRNAVKHLYFQILFDPLKEQLNLPTFFVQICYRTYN